MGDGCPTAGHVFSIVEPLNSTARVSTISSTSRVTYQTLHADSVNIIFQFGSDHIICDE
jgi:hypothetical protein